MTMTYSTSSTSTFTVTHAKYLASKIAADLRQMALFYGRPSAQEIDNYITEVIVLLLEGYLASVTYGFRRNNEWVIAIKYDALTGGGLSDDRAGRVKPGVRVSGATWGSFLIYSPKFLSLSDADRQHVKSQLPIKRSSSEEPRAGGDWISDKSYSNGGVSLQRQMYTKG